MAKFGWGYKISNWKVSDKGISIDLTMSKLRKWYEVIKIILFKIHFNIRIDYGRDR